MKLHVFTYTNTTVLMAILNALPKLAGGPNSEGILHYCCSSLITKRMPMMPTIVSDCWCSWTLQCNCLLHRTDII